MADHLQIGILTITDAPIHVCETADAEPFPLAITDAALHTLTITDEPG